MRLRRMLSAIRARVPRYVLPGEALLGTNGWGVGIVLGQPPLHLAQVLPGVLERAAEAAAGRPPFFAALNLRGADLRCDALDLSVQKLPEVSQPRRQLAGLGALDRLQRFLHAFRLADA